MAKWAYYCENDANAAQWLRNLISANLICDGEVDERSVVEVSPSDLAGFAQIHLCAGISIWSYALREAGWGDDQEVWTASVPCQSFSIAGKGKGFEDERHLWPVVFDLIKECRPPLILGEQVISPLIIGPSEAGKKGKRKISDNAEQSISEIGGGDEKPPPGTWLDLIQSDLEDAHYASGAVGLCSAGVGAPNIRHRLYWFACTSDLNPLPRNSSSWLANPHLQTQSGRGILRPGEGTGKSFGASFQRSAGFRPTNRLADPQRGPDQRPGPELASAQGGCETQTPQQRVWDDVGDGGESSRLGIPDRGRCQPGQPPTSPSRLRHSPHPASGDDRSRLADSKSGGCGIDGILCEEAGGGENPRQPECGRNPPNPRPPTSSWLGNPSEPRPLPGPQPGIHFPEAPGGAWDAEPERSGPNGSRGAPAPSDRLGDPISRRLPNPAPQTSPPPQRQHLRPPIGIANGPHDPWGADDTEFIYCLDGKFRPIPKQEIIKSEFQRLADGDSIPMGGSCPDQNPQTQTQKIRNTFPLGPRLPGDVGRLRGYGNALNAVVAREFVAGVMELLQPA